MPELMQAPDIIAVAERTGRPVEDVTARLPRARPRGSTSSGCSARSTSSRSPRARSAGRSRPCARTASTRSPSSPRCALADAPAAADAGAAVDAYLEARAAQVRRLRAVTASLTVEGTGDLPALMLAVRAVRALAG